MKNIPKSARQSGIALVVSLLLLVIMTIGGVAMVGGTILQERMSANHRIQALAFEAASAGIAEALSFGINRDNWTSDANGDPLPCRKTVDDWIGPWGGATAGVADGWNSFLELGPDGLGSEYRLVVFCREDPDLREELQDSFEPGQLPPQLFVVSAGRVIDARGSVLSSRQIEVRVEDFAGTDGNADPAIRIEGNPVAYSGAGGNFVVDGDGGPAIGTDGEDNAGIVEDAIKSQFMGNYKGGIVDSTGNSPFDNPDDLRDWVLAIKEAVQKDKDEDGWCAGNFVDGNARKGGNDPQCNSGNHTSLDDLPLGWETGALTYITGDLTVGPNAIADGSGIVIVEGNVCWSGNSSMEGKVIALGGLYKMSGGGAKQAAGRTDGSIFVTKLDLYEQGGWGQSELKVQGGGGHLVAYDCLADQAQWALLDSCKLAHPWEKPECLDDGTRAPGLGAKKWITSWRENLGWREGIFVDE